LKVEEISSLSQLSVRQRLNSDIVKDSIPIYTTRTEPPLITPEKQPLVVPKYNKPTSVTD